LQLWRGVQHVKHVSRISGHCWILLEDVGCGPWTIRNKNKKSLCWTKKSVTSTSDRWRLEAAKLSHQRLMMAWGAYLLTIKPLNVPCPILLLCISTLRLSISMAMAAWAWDSLTRRSAA
jgi:hypothetical protein